MGYIPSNFKSNNNLRIVMSEEVYTRLAGCINLCGLYMGRKKIGFLNLSNGQETVDPKDPGAEFGTVLYGNFDEYGTIQLETPSKWDDYLPKSGSFSLSDKMRKEMDDNIILGKYQVVCHVHTHPHIQGDLNRHYSQSDIDYYRKLSTDYSNATTLGCMLSVGAGNVSSQDDISFVIVDPKTKEIYNISNVSVNINGRIVPLAKQRYVYTDQRSGQKYPTETTLFEIDETLINNSGSIRR